MQTINETQVIERYISGDNIRAIARDNHITPQTLYNILKRNNVPKRASHRQEQTTKLINACRDGAIVSLSAKQLGISESTATRALRRHRTGGAIEVKRGRPSLSRSRVFAINSSNNRLDECNDLGLSQVPFPYPQISPAEISKEFSRLRACVSRIENNKIQPRSPIGLKLCYPFFPNRYTARSSSRLSAFDMWHDIVALRKAIQFQIDHGDPTTPSRVLRAITMRCRTPSIFRPAVAKFVYERYCPRGGCVWDPCSGYGGRLLGAVAAGVQYIGTDVDAATIDGNQRLAQAIEAVVELNLAPAETFVPPKVDLVFTSPPYFNREKYSRGETQSWRRHGGSLDAWVEGFVRPVAENARKALPLGGHFILNIANLKEDGKTIPLVERTIETAIAAGFSHAETILMPLAAINRKDPTEPVLVFRKM